MLATVPKPGFSFNGIQRRSTIALTIKVRSPISESNVFASPCAKTDQGALPRPDWINNESPIPNIKRPKNRIDTLETDKSQRPTARQGVIGIVLWGRKNSINREVNDIYRG